MSRQQVAKEPFQGGELSCRSNFLSVLSQRRQEGAHDVNVDSSRIDVTAGAKRQLALDQKLLKLCQVAQIVAQRMRRNVALMAQVIGSSVGSDLPRVFPRLMQIITPGPRTKSGNCLLLAGARLCYPCAYWPWSRTKFLFRNCRGDTLSGVLHHPEANSAGASVILCHGMESNKNSDKLVLMSDALAAARHSDAAF